MLLKIENNTRLWALMYARKGYRVVPLYSVSNGYCTCRKRNNCKNAGKHPITKHGYKDGSSNVEQIKRWWKQYPFANIGVVIEGFAVLDCDPRHGAPSSIEALSESRGLIPDTPITLSGGNGYHIYCQPIEAQLLKGKSSLDSGIELKDKGYIIVPPSKHISGKLYKWKNNKSILNYPINTLPEWAYETLKSYSKKSSVSFLPKDQKYWNITEKIPDGARNETLTSLAGILIQRNVPAQLALELVCCVNKARCIPPLDNDEVIAILNSISQRKIDSLKRN